MQVQGTTGESSASMRGTLGVGGPVSDCCRGGHIDVYLGAHGGDAANHLQHAAILLVGELHRLVGLHLVHLRGALHVVDYAEGRVGALCRHLGRVHVAVELYGEFAGLNALLGHDARNGFACAAGRGVEQQLFGIEGVGTSAVREAEIIVAAILDFNIYYHNTKI